MRVLYLTAARFRCKRIGEKANAIQVRRSLSALSRHCDLDVVGSYVESKCKTRDTLKAYCDHICLTRVVSIRFVGILLYAMVSVVKLTMRKSLYDIIYSRNILILFVFSLLLFWKPSKILELHMPPSSLELFLLKILVKFFGLKVIFCVSEVLSFKLLKSFGEYEVEVKVLRNTADKKFELIAPLPENISKEVMYIGSLSKRKGSDIIMAMANRMPDYNFFCYSHFVSMGKKKLPSNVSICSPVDPSEVPSLIQNFNGILIAPYVTGINDEMDDVTWGSPIKIFEYMASGRPFLASNIETIREIIGEDYPYLVNPSNLDGWVSTVKSFQAKSVGDFFGLRTQEKYIEKFSIETRAMIQVSCFEKYA